MKQQLPAIIAILPLIALIMPFVFLWVLYELAMERRHPNRFAERHLGIKGSA